MKPPINLVGGAFFSVIVSVVGLAEPLNNGINFEEIEPGLGFGTPCAQAQAHLTHIGVSYKQMSEHQWILITRGQIIGHALYPTNEAASVGPMSSRISCSPDVGIYRVQLTWSGNEKESVYNTMLKTLTTRLKQSPNLKKVRRRGSGRCATWPPSKAKASENTIQLCETQTLTTLDARSPTLEKAAKAARSIKKMKSSSAP